MSQWGVIQKCIKSPFTKESDLRNKGTIIIVRITGRRCLFHKAPAPIHPCGQHRWNFWLYLNNRHVSLFVQYYNKLDLNITPLDMRIAVRELTSNSIVLVAKRVIDQLKKEFLHSNHVPEGIIYVTINKCLCYPIKRQKSILNFDMVYKIQMHLKITNTSNFVIVLPCSNGTTFKASSIWKG